MTTSMPARMLRLLSLMQSRREWSGAELAQRLGITDRTVRRDVERLRKLGYPVHGTTGTAGGYRLASGTALPPLLLDDDEAVAIATALLGAADEDGAGMRALAKLGQVLPARLRGRVAAMHETTFAVADDTARPDPALLAALATACRDREYLRFDYRRRDGAASTRRVEPFRIVTGYGLWYLVAFDPDRGDWRLFRADRITDPVPTRHRFPPRDPPPGGAHAFLVRSIATAPYRYTATATVAAPAEVVERRLTAPLPGRVTAVDAATCRVRLGADTMGSIVADVVAFDAPFTLDAPPEVRSALDELASRLTAARRDRPDPPSRTKLQ